MSKHTAAMLRAKGFRIRDGKAVRGDADSGAPAEPSFTSKPPRMTRVESWWAVKLSQRHPSACIIPQFRVRVSKWDAPVPVHYTADFAVFFACNKPGDPGPFWCHLWEVKDKRRRPHSDELVRAKTVRENNPWISAVFLAVWDGNEWEERRS